MLVPFIVHVTKVKKLLMPMKNMNAHLRYGKDTFVVTLSIKIFLNFICSIRSYVYNTCNVEHCYCVECIAMLVSA